jgi:hypothetical protein
MNQADQREAGRPAAKDSPAGPIPAQLSIGSSALHNLRMARTNPLPRIVIATLLLILSGARVLAAQDPQIYWGDDVPSGWNGDWPEELQTIPERTGYTRTVSTLDLHEWIAALKGKSENVHVVEMFTSPLKKVAPAMVLASPRVTSPQEARASGKPVLFLLGNIHPPEPEAAEALLMVARDLAAGKRKAVLDNLIVMIAPVYNVDGTDNVVEQDGRLGSETPLLLGVRANSDGLDLNRDGVKLQSVETNGLYRTLNEWDPLLLLDGHLMSRVSHGYANTYGTTTVPAAAPGPRLYMEEKLFPAVRDQVKSEFRLEVFTHALQTPNRWPPQAWSHDRAAWTVEAKFIVNDYGLRNRFAIITETPGQPTFERRIYAQYAYIAALLDYVRTHAAEMQAIVKKADADTVQAVLDGAEAGTLTNFLDGEYRSRGKINLLAYQTSDTTGPPEVVPNVDDLTNAVGTRTAKVPRAYVLSPNLAAIAEKLRAHNVQVKTLESPVQVEGEEFTIERMTSTRRSGYAMATLEGTFSELAIRDFPAGSFYVDMAQPMANATFYYLEPQSRDGFVAWHLLDEALRELGADKGTAVYPIFKVRRVVKKRTNPR